MSATHRLILVRVHSGPDSSIGVLILDGNFLIFDIEDERRDVKVPGETRIPAGVYPLGLRHSPRFSKAYNHDMIWIKDVPGFEFILIHWGNNDKDTAGCLVVGDGVYYDARDESGKITGGTSRPGYERSYRLLAPLIRDGSLKEIEVYDSIFGIPR